MYKAQAHGAATKIKLLHATERDSPRVKQARQEFSHTILRVASRRLKFIDESGVNLSMTRMYGRAPKGERVSGSVPDDHGPNVTMVGSMGFEGISAAMSFEGPMNGAVFKVFVEQVLGPTLVEGDVVVMDNLPAHKVMGIEQAVKMPGVVGEVAVKEIVVELVENDPEITTQRVTRLTSRLIDIRECAIGSLVRGSLSHLMTDHILIGVCRYATFSLVIGSERDLISDNKIFRELGPFELSLPIGL